MRLCYVSSGYVPALGGVESHVSAIATRMAASGHQVEVIAHTRDASLPRSERIDRVLVRRFPLRLDRGPVAVAPGLWRYAASARGRHDIVHAQNYHAIAALAGPVIATGPLIFTPHYMPADGALLTAMHAVYRPVGARLARRATHIVCVSNSEAATVRRDLAPQATPISVIPNGIDAAVLRAAIPHDVEGVVVLSAGRLDAYKNVAGIIRAVARLDDRFCLFVAGDGPDRPGLERLRQQLGVEHRVIFLGVLGRDELARWFGTADVYVTLSPREAFDIAAVEAMVAGARVVASDIPAHREVLAEGRDDVVFVPAAIEPSGLAGAVRELLARPRTAGDAPTAATWDDVAEAHERLYHAVLHPGRGRVVARPRLRAAVGHDGRGRPASNARRPPEGAALDVLVLDAATRQSLVCVRALGRAGLRVGALECAPRFPAATSRYAAVTGVLPPFDEDPDAFVDAVIRRARHHRAGVVFTSHDGAIAALQARRADLEAAARLTLAPPDALATAMSKASTLAVARSVGVDVPFSVAVARMDDAEPALRETGLPVVIKPDHSWLSDGDETARLGAAAAADPPGALEAIDAIVRLGGTALLQPWLPGRREAVNLFYADGVVWARFAQVAHRMCPPLGGSSVVRESIAVPDDIGAAAERLVRAIGLEGYSEVEFRRDAHGQPMLMEINPRLSASVEIALRSGVDFPRLLHAWAAGRPLWEIPSYRLGVRMRWLGGDILWLLWTLRGQGLPDSLPSGRALRTFAFDCLRPAGYDYVDASDPVPAFVAGATMASDAARIGSRAGVQALSRTMRRGA